MALFVAEALFEVIRRDPTAGYVQAPGQLGLSLALAELPTVMTVAWKLAPRVREKPAPFPRILLVGGSLLTVVVGSFVTSLVLSVLAGLFNGEDLGTYVWFGTLIFGIAGLILYSLPILVLVIPSGIVWLWAMRRTVAPAFTISEP